MCPSVSSNPLVRSPFSGADPQNSERRGRVPHSPPRMKTLLQPDCIIITTLEKRLEGLGLYKNVLKIQEERGGRGPLGPSPKSANGISHCDRCLLIGR